MDHIFLCTQEQIPFHQLGSGTEELRMHPQWVRSHRELKTCRTGANPEGGFFFFFTHVTAVPAHALSARL